VAPPARGVKGAATAAPTAATNAGPAIAGTASGADATPAGPAEWPPAPQPAAAAAPAHQQASGMPCAASAQACVSLSRHEAWLTDGNGRITYGPVPATGGSSTYPTPTGTPGSTSSPHSPTLTIGTSMATVVCRSGGLRLAALSGKPERRFPRRSC